GSMSEPRPFHRMFALSWQDFFEGTAIEVEAETDLSLKQQFLDLVLIRTGPGPLPRRPPDGFDDPGDYTLITFKSHQEALDLDALWELVAHFVNYFTPAAAGAQRDAAPVQRPAGLVPLWPGALPAPLEGNQYALIPTDQGL